MKIKVIASKPDKYCSEITELIGKEFEGILNDNKGCFIIDSDGDELELFEGEFEIASESAEFQEAKSEILSIVYEALVTLEKESGHNEFMCENGTAWTYDKVREFLKKHIKE